MMHGLKFIVLQGILAAGLAALYTQGALKPLYESEGRWFILGVLLLAGYGLLKTFQRQWNAASWVSQMLVRIGIIGLQLAMASALVVIGTLLIGSDMVAPLRTFLVTIGQGLYVSIVALISSVLVDTNSYFLGGERED